MSAYQVKFYSGEYRNRQSAANNDGAVAYVEHHFNSATSPTARYTCVIVGSNASDRSKAWGADYARRVADAFSVPLYDNGTDPPGLHVGGFGGRGDANIKHTRMPAILLEPLFVSNPQHAAMLRTDLARQRLAACLADSIRRCFPDGGLIAFSVGHKGKPSRPSDRGAPLIGGTDGLAEADIAQDVMGKAKQLLEAHHGVSDLHPPDGGVPPEQVAS